jgi:hypothetical protein
MLLILALFKPDIVPRHVQISHAHCFSRKIN